MKKVVLLNFVGIIIFFSLITAISGADANTTLLDENVNDLLKDNSVIYVSGDGSDSGGDGSSQSPFKSIGHAVNSASNNSKIIIKSGTYKGLNNTDLEINTHLTIESESGNVTIDGENKYTFFKINPSSSLILSNIKFVNGFTDSYVKLSMINNMGNLTIINSNFNNMNSVISTIFNQANLKIINSTITNSISQNMAQSIVNLANCTIINSKIIAVPVHLCKIEEAIYNYNKLTILNSNVGLISSNNQYDEARYKKAEITIENSSLSQINIDDALITISASKITSRAMFRYSDVKVRQSNFTFSSNYVGMSIHYCNFTAIHSIFDLDISTGYSDLNITYSAILKNLYGGGKYGYIYAPYNWWGLNTLPELSYVVNSNITYWAVCEFKYEDSEVPINPQKAFITTLNKWSDGTNLYDFKSDESLPVRYARFESQSGNFIYPTLKLDKSNTNYLVGNTVDGKVYVVVDRQRLAIDVGNTLSNVTFYVSSKGHDAAGGGSYDNPFLTLEYAVSKAGNGNTICILGPLSQNQANSNILINKNLTIIGFNNASITRSNTHSVFNIAEWGSLSLKNIRFSVSSSQYTNSIITLSGGNLKITNSTFSNMRTSAVISTSNGVEGNGNVIIQDSRFENITGSAVGGVSKILILNSNFTGFTNFYNSRGFESYNCIFPITSSIEIYDSRFTDNKIGIVNLHPYTYSLSQYANNYTRYAYVENSVFENNQFTNVYNSYSTNGIAFNTYDDYGSFHGFINNCSFIGNDGIIAKADSVNGCTFILNTAEFYGGDALVKSEVIYNSVFLNNTNLYRDGPDGYTGEGIASADTILNSTFMYNKAAFGGAVSKTNKIHYCVFVNNTSLYGGNDIFSQSGDVDYSTNWWGDNQKPGSERIFKFLGTLTLNDWVIMSLEYTSSRQIRASFNKCIDINGNIHTLNQPIPQRPVYFSVDNGQITPEFTYLSNGEAYAFISIEQINNDFKVFAVVDNQKMEVNVRNSHTQIIISDASFKGKDNKYTISLININGFKISTQTLLVEVISDGGESQVFTIITDGEGNAFFNVDYPVGVYRVNVKYLGNGQFTKSNATATIEVVISPTFIISYNHTYYGKTNSFSAILNGENGAALSNFTLKFTISDSSGRESSITLTSDIYGMASTILSLDVGQYTVRCEFLGDGWYSPSYSISKITVKPVNTTITLPAVTLYGQSNQYNITLRDVFGGIVRGENIYLTISKGDISDKFTLKTNDDGVASITINYLPGTYTLEATFLGDDVYGSSKATAQIKIEKVLCVLSGFSHTTIPVNGTYTAVLSDMYGKRVGGEEIILKVYQGKLLKQYSNVSDANGEVAFKMDLAEGTYLITFEYMGNTWYSSSDNAATLVINNDVKMDDIYINASDLVEYYGENKYFIIQFKDPNAYSQYGKLIQVVISTKTWSGAYNLNTDIFGLARLKIDLNPGEYEITYKYTNAYYGMQASGKNKISVFKMPTTIMAKDVILSEGDTGLFEIYLRDVNNNLIKNMQINVEINGEVKNITTNNDGIAKLPLNLPAGEYTIKYSLDNPNYISSASSSKILVIDSSKTPSNIIAEDINCLDNETVSFKVKLSDKLNNGIASSQIKLEVISFDGQSLLNMTKLTDSEGIGEFNFNLDWGNYMVRLNYNGNDFYMPASQMAVISVNSSDNKTKTILFGSNTHLTDSKDYYVVLSDANGLLLKNSTVIFTLNGTDYEVVTDSDAKAYLPLDLAPDVYTVKAFFRGDETYKSVSLTSKLFISGKSTWIYAQPLVKYFKNGTQFHARLMDMLSNPISGKTVTVFLSGSYYNTTTDDAGWITLNIDLLPGFYEVECHYRAAHPNENSFNKTTITVLSTIISSDEVKYFGEMPYLKVTFLDGTGRPINNTPFILGIDGKNYYALTDDGGLFSFDVNLKVGSHTISFNNPYDGLYASYNLEILPTIYANDLVKVIYTGSYYSASFLNKKGQPLKNHKVYIIINGINYTQKTNARGILELPMNLKPGNYIVTAVNPQTGEYVQNTLKILPSIVKNKNIVMYVGQNLIYKVQIIGKNFLPVGKGVGVIFKINGVKYKVKTDKNGWAKFKLKKAKLKPGKYKISLNYNSYSVSNTVKVKHIINAKKKTHAFKSLKVKITLKAKKPLKGKKLSVKFKGKVYLLKTNKAGVCYFKLNRQVLGSLDKSKWHSYSIIYKNDVLKRYFKVK